MSQLIADRDVDVSILAQPGGRALRSGWDGLDMFSWFQSSPSPGAGRCLADGGNLVSVLNAVSILAQPGGRALPPQIPGLAAGFQVSILAQPGGRALPPQIPGLAAGFQVSILAQPGGRALPDYQQPKRAMLLTRFNPRPARGPGAALVSLLDCPTKISFQSSPSPGAGRCTLTPRGSRPATWFQSSPSPGAGRC